MKLERKYINNLTREELESLQILEDKLRRQNAVKKGNFKSILKTIGISAIIFIPSLIAIPLAFIPNLHIIGQIFLCYAIGLHPIISIFTKDKLKEVHYERYNKNDIKMIKQKLPNEIISNLNKMSLNQQINYLKEINSIGSQIIREENIAKQNKTNTNTYMDDLWAFLVKTAYSGNNVKINNILNKNSTKNNQEVKEIEEENEI